ncbi:MAG: fatty acid desaturase [Elusimicrobia bacterium]|nr:fatty acid desaturase [Elusimicrobiota bacterium]
MTVTAAPPALESWQRLVEPYKRADAIVALGHLAAGLALLAVFWAAMAAAYALPYGPLWGLLLAVPAGMMQVKLFTIQHDCGHGALFNQGWANDLVGRLLCPLVLTPYTQWAREHAKHHATSGHLDFRGIGDVDTWTVREYRAATAWRRFWYRVLRHPLFLFGPGASGYFLIKQRFVWYQAGRRESWLSVWSTNLALAAFVAAGCWSLGAGRFFWLWLPSTAVASGFGTWIFYIGHQYPSTYWEKDEDWDFFEASMRGSSFYRAGTLVDWITCNIGYHHLHHLCSRIPFYNLPRCLAENRAFQVKPLGLRESLSCAFLALWDEDAKRLVRF